MSQGPGFEQLRKILLEQDREEREELAQKLAELDSQLNDKEKLQERVNPILVDQEGALKRNFSHLFGPQITESISKQIRDSQDEVVEVLYPILGRMIKKYITSEIEKLSERVDAQMKDAFSWESWKARIKAWVSGTPQKNVVMAKLIEPKIEEIFVIERNSGILIGSYSKKQSLDGDMVAGMLTAIKAFVEDAFAADAQELESIEYENYKVIVKNFRSFFISVVCSGVANAEFKDKLDNQLLDFAEKVLSKAKETDKNQELVSTGLEEHFNAFDDVSE